MSKPAPARYRTINWSSYNDLMRLRETSVAGVRVGILPALAFAATLALAGCAPTTDFSGSGPVEYSPAESASHGSREQLFATATARLLAVPGVTSVGVGFGPAGGEALAVGVLDAGVAARLPTEVEGLPVVVTVTGEVEAQPQR